MKTYKIIEEDGKFIIERKDKKTGNRVKLFGCEKKVVKFDTKEEAKNFFPSKNCRLI